MVPSPVVASLLDSVPLEPSGSPAVSTLFPAFQSEFTIRMQSSRPRPPVGEANMEVLHVGASPWVASPRTRQRVPYSLLTTGGRGNQYSVPIRSWSRPSYRPGRNLTNLPSKAFSHLIRNQGPNSGGSPTINPSPLPPSLEYGVRTGATTYALDRSDGSVYWEYRSGYGYSGTAPVFVDDVVAVIASRSRSIVGLDARTGEQLWSTPLVQKHPTGIASGENGIYACVPTDDDEAGELVRVEPTTGDIEWRSELHEHVSTPVVGTDRVYLWVGNQLVAFDKSSGEQVWNTPIQTAEHEYPNIAVDNGQCITLEHGDGQKTAVVALDATSGKRQWRRSYAHYVEFDPLAMDGTSVYIPLGDSHEISALDRTDGSVVESWTLPGHPATGVAIDKSRGVLVTRAKGSDSITLLKR